MVPSIFWIQPVAACDLTTVPLEAGASMEGFTMFKILVLLACILESVAGLHDQVEGATVAPPPQEKEVSGEKKEEEKPPVYPDLKALHKQQIKRYFAEFKNKNPEKRRAAEKQMIAIGRGAVPELLRKSTTKSKDQAQCIYNSLLVLLDERDIYTLKNCYTSKVELMRMLAVVKISTLKKPDLVDFLKKALEDEVPDIRLEAALGLLAMKDPSGIRVIIMKVAENRKNPSKRLFKDLPLLHGKVYDSLFTPYLIRNENPDVRIATTLVITGIGDPRLKSILGRALSDPNNLVQGAVVNALRKLVRNEEPRKFSSTFELIETVQKWRKDLGLIR